MQTLKLIRFGNPILRQTARRLSETEIKSSEIQRLIKDIRKLNEVKKYGVGLAAPQVGHSIALSIIMIQQTADHPHVVPFSQVIINPEYEGLGRRRGKWEGCLSTGRGKDILFGKALRYAKIRARWYDEAAELHNEILTGITAHVFQHETDHLNGVLFVDRVRDSRSYMMADEYRKRIVRSQLEE